MESAWAIAGNKLEVFSQQQVISCDKDSDDAGCGGGDPPTAYAYIKKAGGLASGADYPFVDDQSDDKTAPCKDFTVDGGTISGFSYATPACDSGSCDNQDETTLAAHVASTGPPSVCVDASGFDDYTGGVMTSKSCSSAEAKLDHCVQIVGYNQDAETPYWIVRNQWDSDWGEAGYVYLKFGENTCGVADEATLPTIG